MCTYVCMVLVMVKSLYAFIENVLNWHLQQKVKPHVEHVLCMMMDGSHPLL